MTYGLYGATRYKEPEPEVIVIDLRETRSLAELRDSRVGELLVAVLAPPEPPDESERRKGGEDI